MVQIKFDTKKFNIQIRYTNNKSINPKSNLPEQTLVNFNFNFTFKLRTLEKNKTKNVENYLIIYL